MRFSHFYLPVVSLLFAGSALAQPASSVHTYQEFSTHLLSAQSHNHLLGEFGTGSEDSVDFDSLRLAGEFDVANLRVAQTPVELSLIGQYQTVDVEVDGPPAAPRRNAELDTINIGAKGAWTVPAAPKLQIGTGAYVSIADFDAPDNADDSESGVVGFGSARYAITPRFDTYGTVFVSTEDRVQDSGVVAGLLYDLGRVAFGAEVSTPDDTTVTPFISYAVTPTLRLNGGITTGTEPDPVFRGQLAWVFDAGR